MAVSHIPAGMHAVIPHLVLRGADKAIELYKKAFGMTEVMRMPGPDGKGVMHAEMKLGDSHIFLADEWPGMELAAPEKFGGTTVSIHLYVADCDALFAQAVAAGCKPTMPPMTMFWGDRFAKLVDPFGHSWSIATHVEDVPIAELAKRSEEAMKNMGKGC
jgi:uncharacterized glyoxalase superfamily protein PhnB